MIGTLNQNPNNVQSCLSISASYFTTSLILLIKTAIKAGTLCFIVSSHNLHRCKGVKSLQHCLCSNLVLFLLNSIGKFSNVERWHQARLPSRGELQICLWVDATFRAASPFFLTHGKLSGTVRFTLCSHVCMLKRMRVCNV